MTHTTEITLALLRIALDRAIKGSPPTLAAIVAPRVFCPIVHNGIDKPARAAQRCQR
jgi:hypothetical protein